MKKNKMTKNTAKLLIVYLCLFLTGCSAIGVAREAQFESAYENTQEEEPIDIYTSEAVGVVEAVDAKSSTAFFYLTDRKEEKELIYDGAVSVCDSYGSAMVMEQLKPGDVVEIAYNSELGKLGRAALSGEAWRYDGIEKYRLEEEKGVLKVGNDVYNLDGSVKIYSNGQAITPDQILKQDVISVRGIGHEVLSITVDKGHGYLELKNEEALIGGWIEIGQAVIQEISEDMLITVPEGDYRVRLLTEEVDETREVSIARNQETVLDLKDIEIPKPTSGRVLLDIIPEDAKVVIDETAVDPAFAVRLPFGIHKITASAPGYDSASEYFEVEGETTTVRMTLEEKEETGTVSGNEAEEEENGATVTIAGPEGAEVYQDNRYIGIAPVTYEKIPGDHVITLRKSGYETRSYNIKVADDDRDETYSFPELAPEEWDESIRNPGTVSGNNSSKGESGKHSSDQDKDSSHKEDQDTVSGNNGSVSDNENSVSGNH